MDKLLIVDDEEQVLSSLRRHLSRAGDYSITTVTDPIQGLAYACGFEYGVVLVDYSMPRLDGVRFLELLREVRPAVRGIVISGRGEKEIPVSALNRGRAFHYMDKPWQPEELSAVIDRGFREYRRLIHSVNAAQNPVCAKINTMSTTRIEKVYGIK